LAVPAIFQLYWPTVTARELISAVADLACTASLGHSVTTAAKPPIRMPKGLGTLPLRRTGAVVNPIEKVMVRRSALLTPVMAEVALVLVLWATGSSLQSLWITPFIIFVLWIAIQLGHGHRRHCA
jgi:hypothetical protein